MFLRHFYFKDLGFRITDKEMYNYLSYKTNDLMISNPLIVTLNLTKEDLDKYNKETG